MKNRIKGSPYILLLLLAFFGIQFGVAALNTFYSRDSSVPAIVPLVRILGVGNALAEGEYPSNSTCIAVGGSIEGRGKAKVHGCRIECPPEAGQAKCDTTVHESWGFETPNCWCD